MTIIIDPACLPIAHILSPPITYYLGSSGDGQDAQRARPRVPTHVSKVYHLHDDAHMLRCHHPQYPWLIYSFQCFKTYIQVTSYFILLYIVNNENHKHNHEDLWKIYLPEYVLKFRDSEVKIF